MHNLFPFLTTTLAFLLCLLSSASSVATPNKYTARNGILKRLYTKTSLHRPPVIRQNNLSYLVRDVARTLTHNPQSRTASVKYPKLNANARPLSPGEALRVKHSSSVSWKISTKLKKVGSGALPFQGDERLNRRVEGDNIPTHQRQSSGRLTGERCNTSSDCAGTHFCSTTDERNNPIPCDGQSDCICLADNFDDFLCSCKYPECLPGEICNENSRGNFACVSSALDRPAAECPPGTTSPSPGNGTGGTFESCESSSDCAESHFCSITEDSVTQYCDGQPNCECLPDFLRFVRCSCDEPDCLPVDSCSTLRDGSIGCVSSSLGLPPAECQPNNGSPTPTPSTTATSATTIPPTPTITTISVPTPTPPVTRPPRPDQTEQVCIDAKALSHLYTHQLVYEQHPVSRVLCDKFGSCATPGHIVHFNGSALMMKKYCERAGCEERVMEVNSPRYKKGMRVASKTDGLEYTVFAARYETRAEEAVLATAVHMGL